MFKRSSEADKWFSKIEKTEPFKTILDQWYVCCLVGLLTAKFENPYKPIDAAQKLPSNFDASKRILIGLLILAEINRTGIEYGDHDSLQRLLNRLIESESAAKLTDEGYEKLNEYAYGGFLVLSEAYGEKPNSTEEFLVVYTKKLEQWISESPIL